ncbi:hypothetical protein BKA65DRAFT_481485 [Rhexocercosporidium sp. MPI-PUGE-AT-0058]|nr:hypothetical protein BKA65DRAFT_481485 [Rhexocercosporidium sp. MPI-PUGE-AT-0058]
MANINAYQSPSRGRTRAPTSTNEASHNEASVPQALSDSRVSSRGGHTAATTSRSKIPRDYSTSRRPYGCDKAEKGRQRKFDPPIKDSSWDSSDIDAWSEDSSSALNGSDDDSGTELPPRRPVALEQYQVRWKKNRKIGSVNHQPDPELVTTPTSGPISSSTSQSSTTEAGADVQVRRMNIDTDGALINGIFSGLFDWITNKCDLTTKKH